MGHTSTLTLLVCLSLVQPYLSFDVNTIKLPKQFLDQFIEQKAQSYTLDDLERATDFISTAWDTGHNEYDLRALPDETDKNTIKPPLVKINIQKNGLFDHLYADGEAINRYTSKREVLDTNSCGLGKEFFSMETQDVCTGVVCRVTQIQCGSTITDLDMQQSVNSIPWDRCFVTELECYDDTYALHSYNLKDQYDVTSCFASGFFCDAGLTIGSCMVEILCSDYTSFGYSGFGLQCRNDNLMCNGQTIPPSQYDQMHDSIAEGACQITSNICLSPDDFCTRLVLECNDRSTDGCAAHRMEVQCVDPSSFFSSCVISKVNCGGVISNTDSTTSLHTCSIDEIICDGSRMTFDNMHECMVDILICNGVEVDPQQYNGDISQCIIRKQVSCVSNLDNTTCVSYQLTCSEAPVCIFNSSSCDIECSRQLNTSSCVCPDDYVGTACEQTRELNCSLVSIDSTPPACLPGPSDDPNDYMLDGDRKCNVYSLTQQSKLGYFLDCRFSVEPPPTNISFDYWIATDQVNYAMSASRTCGLVRYASPLRKKLHKWPGPRFFLLENDVPDRYWYGRRLYVEISFNPATAPSPYWSSRASLLRQFLDVPDRPITIYNNSSLKPWQIALVVIGVVIAVGAIGLGGFIYYKKSTKKTKSKKSIKNY